MGVCAGACTLSEAQHVYAHAHTPMHANACEANNRLLGLKGFCKGQGPDLEPLRSAHAREYHPNCAHIHTHTHELPSEPVPTSSHMTSQAKLGGHVGGVGYRT